MVAVGAVAELEGTGAAVVMGAVDHEAIGNLLLGKVGDRLVHPEHVLAEGAAVAPVADPVAADDELVAGGEEADFLRVGLVGVEKVAVVRLAPGRDGVEFDSIVCIAVQSNVSEHQSRPLSWCCRSGGNRSRLRRHGNSMARPSWANSTPGGRRVPSLWCTSWVRCVSRVRRGRNACTTCSAPSMLK